MKDGQRIGEFAIVSEEEKRQTLCHQGQEQNLVGSFYTSAFFQSLPIRQLSRASSVSTP